MTALVTIGAPKRPGRVDRPVTTTPEIVELLAANSPCAIGVSGGKDSCALALATVAYLDAIGHTGPRLLIHSDLGRTEWRESLPVCERLAAVLGLELVVVRRNAGDMMDRWLVRQSNNVERYADLSCVKLILPWSTPGMRFCTSELKTAVICRELVRRFPGQTIISACGIRRDESPKRKLAPVAKHQAKLTSRPRKTSGIDWHPVIDWTLADVFAYLADQQFALHEAYTKFGMSRVSCVYCIMSKEDDLVASTTCPDNHDTYREMVGLEITSTFAFQGGKWLGDIAPHLLDDATRAALVEAKVRAARRIRAEERIPAHLLYEKGWPKVMPTWAEAVLLCEVRREVADAVGLTVEYLTPEEVIKRYADLMALNVLREAAKAKKTRRDDNQDEELS